jgi:hypothetical protein
MKKISVFSAFAVFVSLLAISVTGIASAQTTQFTGLGSGTVSTVGGFTFTFSDVYTYPPFTAVGGNGEFSVSGNYAPGTANPLQANGVYNLTDFDFSLGGTSIINGGTGAIDIVGNNISLAGTGAGSSDTLVYDAVLNQNSSNPSLFTASGLTGNYTVNAAPVTPYVPAPTTAPEASSAVAFGAMLAAGGLLLFAAKRRSSSTIA